MEKRTAGFRFGRHRLEVLQTYGELTFRGRTYRLVKVRTEDGLEYKSIRFYNAQGRFIKQLLFEPEVTRGLVRLLLKSIFSGKST